MRKVLLTSLATLYVAGPAFAQDDWRQTAADALPDSGEFHLQLVFNDQVDGFMRFGWTHEDGVVRAYDRSMLASMELYETMVVHMEDNSFAPISAQIRFHQQSSIMSVDTESDGERMTGMRSMMHPLQGRQEAPVDLPLTDGAMPRAATFLLAPYMPLEVGDSISYDWYAPIPNVVATVTLTAFEGGRVETPAGVYEDTIRVELRGAQPFNDIYLSTDENREIVRIDIVGQNMYFQRVPEPAPAAQ